jgi:hypothetical protein
LFLLNTNTGVTFTVFYCKQYDEQANHYIQYRF